MTFCPIPIGIHGLVDQLIECQPLLLSGHSNADFRLLERRTALIDDQVFSQRNADSHVGGLAGGLAGV